VVADGYLFWGALIFLLGAGLDMLDGDLARLQGKVSRRGAFLDSTFDRLGEAALFAGLAWYYVAHLAQPRPWAVLFILGTVVGSLTTSYVRARAEGLQTTCHVGLLQRPERVVLLGVGMLLGWRVLEVVLGILAVLTLATTVQRLIHVARKLPGAGQADVGFGSGPPTTPREEP
jgi:CDP-diacylglycerol--glycerol-3-phosphate 3-phosphatidyltransferase